MEIKKIESLQNEYIKKLIKLQKRKHREEMSLFIVEGERSCRDALCSSFEVENIVMSESYFENKKGFECENAVLVSDKIFASISDTKTPQGVLAVVKIPRKKEIKMGRFIFCDGIQDPGNAGTIMRSADAFGFSGVIFRKGSVDVFSPKVIRSTMGSIFHIDVWQDEEKSILEDLQKKGFKISASALSGESVTSKEMKAEKNHIFVVGNEGAGVSKEILELADEIVYIKMQGKAESLNAGVAASILMYEVSRDE